MSFAKPHSACGIPALGSPLGDSTVQVFAALITRMGFSSAFGKAIRRGSVTP